jgi:hypothetical protein
MAITCFHGIGVRHVNLYGENDRHSHGERLLEATHTNCPEAMWMRVCYDMACQFESTVQSINNDWSKQISLGTEGFGLVIGRRSSSSGR